MTTQEIANFIQAQLKLGSTRPEIERILSLNRITPQEISASFDLVLATTAPAPSTETVVPITIQTPTSTPPVPGSATADRAFPPPAMALHSIDSVAPTPPPVTPPVQPPPLPPTPPAPVTPPPIINRPPAMSSPLMPPVNMNARPPAPKIITSVVEKKSGGGKWLVLFFLLILLGVGGTGAYAYIAKPVWAEPFMTPILNLIQPTPPVVVEPIIEAPIVPVDPTANWQTYTNEKYGFEFKYPTDWIVGTTSKDAIVLKNIVTSTASSTTASSSITFDPVLKGLVLTDLTYQNIFDQINATFKFLEPVATSTATTTATSTTPKTTSTTTPAKDLPPAVDLPSLFIPEN